MFAVGLVVAYTSVLFLSAVLNELQFFDKDYWNV